jgi:hypothetical protein
VATRSKSLDAFQSTIIEYPVVGLFYLSNTLFIQLGNSVIFAFDGLHTILSMRVFEVLYGYKDLLFVGNWWKAKKFC